MTPRSAILRSRSPNGLIRRLRRLAQIKCLNLRKSAQSADSIFPHRFLIPLIRGCYAWMKCGEQLPFSVYSTNREVISAEMLSS